MNRAEIIEGLRNIRDRFYAFTDYRNILEACLELLENENALLDRVIEIIDSEAWSYCDYIITHENGNGDKQGAASHLADNIREAVLALKGEQE